MNYTDITSELINHLEPLHQKNINLEAFTDIASVLLDFHYLQDDLYSTKQVCNAAMGHGKTTVITSYLKWNKTIPILLCVKEKQLAHEIYKEVKKVNQSIININADNKELYEMDLSKYQIVIVQHERLKNLALGFGNVYNYQYYLTGDARTKRKLIIDERPPFHDAHTYDITSHNNVLDWFDNLSQPFKMKPLTIQKYKSSICFLVSNHLAENVSDITYALFENDVISKAKQKELVSFLNEMRDHPDNKNKYDHLNSLRHFKELLKVDGYGRIDDYSYGKSGRKIIVSKYIDYNSLKMNMIVFDGTTTVTSIMYKNDFELKEVENRNNYSRLYLYNESMNTSVYARSKNNNGVQKTIAARIEVLKQLHPDIFILPMKDEVNLYYKEKAISDNQIKYFRDNKTEEVKGLNLLNTTGKNVLNNVTTLYLPCLPKRNAEHYKEIAIALYGNDVSLLTSKDHDNSNWFQDDKLEKVYKLEMYAELLQIIHRTALRKINSNDKINIYIAYNDVRESNYHDYVSVIDSINNGYMKGIAHVPHPFKLFSMYDYGRDKKLEGFIDMINEKNITDPIRIGDISQSFRNYLKKNYNDKKDSINIYLNDAGYEIIEKKDQYSASSKYVKRL